MYYAAAFLAGFIFLSGMIAVRKWIFRLIENTVALLDAILGQESDELKQKALIRGLGTLLVSLGIFILLLACILALTAGPLLLYGFLTQVPSSQWDVSSFYIFLALGAGSIIPFFIFQATSKKRDYSDWSIVLHRIALNNSNLARYLFRLEQRWFKGKLKSERNDFVIISGLARAGTTALTTVLHSTGKFHSLSYANMPFLLCPNTWAKFYKPKEQNLRERSHGDKVMFGYNSVEALEEFFWKVHLDDSYSAGDSLKSHEVDESVYRKYLTYQQLLRSGPMAETIYLAKNNNFILRYQSLRKWNKHFKVIFLFRDPVEHANSLLNQHNRYRKMQQEDGFILEYMNWLGHHEFGLNHKKFNLYAGVPVYDQSSLNYWLACWIEFYSTLLPLIPNDPGIILIDYRDFASQPAKVLGMLEQILNLKFSSKPEVPFEGVSRKAIDVDTELVNRALDIYDRLKAIKKQ